LSIQQVTLSGDIGFEVKVDSWSNSYSGITYYTIPSYLSSDASFSSVQKYVRPDASFGNTLWRMYYKKVTATAYLVSGVAAGATVYQNADYSFAFPPAGLASNLLAAQNWLPYEGTIELVEQDVGTVRYRGTKINVVNSSSFLSSMGALVASESLDLATGTTSIQLGCAPRNDYRTFVSKIRKTSQDNIIYLNE
jgi:hypothetical protein